MKKKLVKSLLTLVAAGTLLTSSLPVNAAWQQSGAQWWNTKDEAPGYSQGWDYINGQWYYFNDQGWMQTGWLNNGGNWYYLHDNGTMVTGWLNLGGSWYYLHGNGAMATGWLNLGGNWYYLQENGKMLTGWYKVNNNWYYSDGSGLMATNKWIGNYYVTGNGAMATNTRVGNYYVGADGAWIPGASSGSWQKNNVGWWYQNSDGSYPRSQWKLIDGAWYYFNASGYMLSNTWVGNYYVGANGVMATNTWIGNYYVGADGCWMPGYTNSGWLAAEERQLFDAINTYRIINGIPALTWNQECYDRAKARVNYNVQNNTTGHEPAQISVMVGVNFAAAEGGIVSSSMTGWKSSVGHNNNLLDRNPDGTPFYRQSTIGAVAIYCTGSMYHVVLDYR